MIRWPYWDLLVIFYFVSRSAITGHAQYSVSVERPCPMETVIFTCTAPGDSLRWVPSDVSRITIRPTTSGLNVPLIQSGYTVTLIAFDNTTLTSTLSRTAENGITVSCVDPLPTLTTVGSLTIRLVDPPGPPFTIRHSTLSSSANEVSVSVQWDPPTETGGRDDLTYTVTISPPAQLSATVLTSTSVTVTAQYNVDYTVSVVTTNCAGNSTAHFNFTIDDGEWDKNKEIICRNESCNVTVTPGNIAAVAGGVVGGIVVMLLIILGAIVLLMVLRRMEKKSIRLKSNNNVEMDDTINYQPPAADEEGYNRSTHDLAIGVNEERYSSGQSAQRLSGYGQIGNVTTLEPVVYAVLSSSQKSNTTSTATANQHQVTYATVDIDATKKQAATLPASPTVLADVDKLLDIDQALVQIRSMKHKWRELAETVRLPETMIEQIEDSCCDDSAGCLTEVINQWSCSGQPTWRELADHLSKIGEEQLSKDLMTIYGTMTDDGPGLLNTLTPSCPPKLTGEMVPPRPPKPAPNNEPPIPPRPFKH